MTIQAVPSLGVDDEVWTGPARAAASVPVGPSGVPFAQLLGQGVEAVNQRLLASQSDLQGLALGEAPNLHDVMIGLEESRVALQLMVQVRNRMLEAYQDVMRMQV